MQIELESSGYHFLTGATISKMKTQLESVIQVVTEVFAAKRRQEKEAAAIALGNSSKRNSIAIPSASDDVIFIDKLLGLQNKSSLVTTGISFKSNLHQ